jgi:chorismate synthase
MSFNTFGHMFRVTTFGESHGLAIGCVVDGCPPGIALTEADIQPYLDKRRPGQSRFTTQRQEPDAVKILSGVFSEDGGAQVTTGTPIALLIENVDQRSKDYSAIRDSYRPGHAGYPYDVKYGLHDYRGGGRASARETAMRVAAGAIARKVVPGLNVRGALIQIGPHKIDRARWDWAEVELSGEANADEMRMGNDGKPRFLSNNAGGILGGISTGQPVVARFAVKPTSSILTPRKTVTRHGEEADVVTKGRHDPCVGIRAVPVGEAMMACVIADHYLRHRGQVGESPAWPFRK